MPLTKQQARETIEAGGSVLYKGKLLTKVEHLKYFDGTQEERAAEAESLRARLAELETTEAAAGGETSDEDLNKSETAEKPAQKETAKKK